MKHRKTYGFECDAAESAALTVADAKATGRIISACDWEADQKREEAICRREDRRIRDAVQTVKRKMGVKYAFVAGCFLRGKDWPQSGLSERTFQHRLKKVKDFFDA